MCFVSFTHTKNSKYFPKYLEQICFLRTRSVFSLRKELNFRAIEIAISAVMSVRPSVCLLACISAAPKSFVKILYGEILKNTFPQKSRILLKWDKNTGQFVLSVCVYVCVYVCVPYC